MAQCHAALGDHDAARAYWERLLGTASAACHLDNQHRALCGLGAAERGAGRLAEALLVTEKRLLLAHEAVRLGWQAAAYGELGCLHGLSGNWRRAEDCLQHQLRLARQNSDFAAEAAAACGLGEVAQARGATAEALEWHLKELDLAEAYGDENTICRALGNLGLAQEAAGELEAARTTQERLLRNVSCSSTAQVTALTALGRLHLVLGLPESAMDALYRGLSLAEAAHLLEAQAQLRYRLGLAFGAQGRISEATVQMRVATSLLDNCRREAPHQVQLWDLQSSVLGALQRLLMVELGEAGQALEQAEKARSRALLEWLDSGRQIQPDQHSEQAEPLKLPAMTDLARQEQLFVLYCSTLGSGHLLTWLLTPTGVLGHVALRSTPIRTTV